MANVDPVDISASRRSRLVRQVVGARAIYLNFKLVIIHAVTQLLQISVMTMCRTISFLDYIAGASITWFLTAYAGDDLREASLRASYRMSTFFHS